MLTYLLFANHHVLRAMPARRRGLIGLVTLSLLMGSSVYASKFTVTLDRDTVRVGESVALSLNFEDASPKTPPNLPTLPNLSASYTGQSSQFSFVNGQTTSTVSYNYTIMPNQPGNFTIPAMQAMVEGKAVTSQPVVLKVLKRDAPAGADNSMTNIAFIRLIVPKTEVYLGEPFPIEYQLYFQQLQDRPQMPQLHADGFTLGKMAEPTQTQTQIGSFVYRLVVFKLSATAVKAGELTLGPVECNLTALVPVDNALSGFRFRNYQPYPMSLRSEAQTVHVLPLPTENVPATFNGAVGQFSLFVSAGPTNVAVGDPITVRARIAGRGAMDSLALPSQPQWREFKSYPPTPRPIESNDPLGLSGAKTFEQVLIPQNHEVKSLPAMLFSYFDPNQKSYQTLSGPTIPLSVGQAATTSAQPSIVTGPTPNTPATTSDIIHIKPRLDALAILQPPLVQQPWFLTLQGVPVLAWLSFLIQRKRTEALAKNPRLRRHREVAHRIRTGLEELRTQAAAQQSEDFFATLFRLLQEQIGERLDLPASAITEAVVQEELSGRELAAGTLTELQELFQTCNQARYAAQKTSRELASLIPRVESVLHALQNLKP